MKKRRNRPRNASADSYNRVWIQRRSCVTAPHPQQAEGTAFAFASARTTSKWRIKMCWSLRAAVVFVTVSALCVGFVHAREKGEFRVEIVASRPEKNGESIILTLDGLVTKSSRVISDEALKDYCDPQKTKDGKFECTIFLSVDLRDKEKMTIDHLCRQIERIRKARDTKAHTHVYVITH